LHVREPGSTPVGEALRNLLLARETGDLDGLTEVLLFSAARTELVRTVIAPALATGKLVVAERCYVATLVYQLLASGREREVPWFFDLVRRVHGACLPDAVFLLDVPPAVARARRTARIEDRIEARGAAYEARVRNGFLAALQLDVRTVGIDAAWPFATVQSNLRAGVARLLAARSARSER
jgi:dTMP kinase